MGGSQSPAQAIAWRRATPELHPRDPNAAKVGILSTACGGAGCGLWRRPKPVSFRGYARETLCRPRPWATRGNRRRMERRVNFERFWLIIDQLPTDSIFGNFLYPFIPCDSRLKRHRIGAFSARHKDGSNRCCIQQRARCPRSPHILPRQARRPLSNPWSRLPSGNPFSSRVR